jgi:DNA-binding transcriptional ArsR family regulator
VAPESFKEERKGEGQREGEGIGEGLGEGERLGEGQGEGGKEGHGKGVSSLEKAFSSLGRLRILMALAKEKEINIMGLVRMTGLNHTTVNGHLKALQSLGLIREKRLGKVRLFSFNDENPRAKALREFLFLWSQYTE